MGKTVLLPLEKAKAAHIDRRRADIFQFDKLEVTAANRVRTINSVMRMGMPEKATLKVP